jgi:hypothetical protein
MSSHHLTLPVTDGQVFVERVDNRRIGQHIFCVPYKGVPVKELMLKMDNIRLAGNEEFVKEFVVYVFVGKGSIEPIETIEICVKEVLVTILVYHRKQRSLVRPSRS